VLMNRAAEPTTMPACRRADSRSAMPRQREAGRKAPCPAMPARYVALMFAGSGAPADNAAAAPWCVLRTSVTSSEGRPPQPSALRRRGVMFRPAPRPRRRTIFYAPVYVACHDARQLTLPCQPPARCFSRRALRASCLYVRLMPPRTYAHRCPSVAQAEARRADA